MASQIQLTNTFNEFRQAYNEAANDVTTLQGSNTTVFLNIAGANDAISTLNSANTALYNGTAQIRPKSAQVEDLNVTGSRVVFGIAPVSGNGAVLSDDAGFIYHTGNTSVDIAGGLNLGGTATLANAAVSSLTAERVIFAGTSGAIEDSANFTFEKSVNRLNIIGSANVTGNILVSSNASIGENLNVTGNFQVNTDAAIIVAANGTFISPSGNVTLNTTDSRIDAFDIHAENRLDVGVDLEGWATSVDEDLSVHRVISVEDVDGPSDHAAVNQSDGEDAYAEFIAINDVGNAEQGWVSVGINSSNYAAAQYGVTKADDGYLLYQAPEGTIQSGDLVIGTGGNGTGNKILFSANGFDDPANNTQMTIDPGNKVEISIDTESTSTSTGALVVNGGIGLTGNLNVGGNVNIVGQITLGGGGNTVSLSTLEVDGTIVQTGNNNPADLKDIGIVGSYVSGIDRLAGFVRDASDGVGVFKIFSNANSEFQTDIANTINFADPDLVLAPVQIGSATIANTTASSSTTTGALVVSGGAGVAGAAFIGGIARVLDTTVSTTTGSGALVVSGGVGIAGNTNIGGTATVSSLVETSSIVLKENINPIDNALETVIKMFGVMYDRKDGSNKNEVGMIAEHLDKIAPNLVKKDQNGNPESIFYSRVTAYLVEAIKSLKIEIDELKGKK